MRSASGAKARPFASKLASRKASTGVRTRSAFSTRGAAGRSSLRKDQKDSRGSSPRASGTLPLAARASGNTHRTSVVGLVSEDTGRLRTPSLLPERSAVYRNAERARIQALGSRKLQRGFGLARICYAGLGVRRKD